MRREFFTEVRVGIFIVVSLLLVMIVLFQVGGQHEMFQRQYIIYTNFQDISGLRIGASVQLAGLNVGAVDDIRFPKELLKKEITVVLRIHRKYQDRIREDSVATINTQGLLGDKYIHISVGSESSPLIPDRGIISSRETTSIFALAEKAGTIMDDISQASKTVADMFKTVEGEKGGDLKASIQSIRKSLEQIEKGKGLLHAIIYEPKGEEIISNLAETMKTVKDISSGMELEGKQKTAGLITNLRHVSEDLREITGSIRRGEGTMGMLVRDPGLYNDLRTLFGRVNRNVLLKAVVRATLRENEGEVLK
jgi:phospholipid/cholesterol/gamma-HCH transport system substrate-binding protein